MVTSSDAFKCRKSYYVANAHYKEYFLKIKVNPYSSLGVEINTIK